MNRQRFESHSSDKGVPLWHFPPIVRSQMTMLPSTVSISSPPGDVRNISDDRINPQDTRHGNVRYESTANGDIAFVDRSRSFESTDRPKTPNSLSEKQEWQSRSPAEDTKGSDSETRNPSSPPERMASSQGSPWKASHARNLSSQFTFSTSLNDRDAVVSKEETVASGQKHRRIFSGQSDPAHAHRRLDSMGSSQPIRHHNRVNSAGLDMLSEAVMNKEMTSGSGWPPQEPGPANASSMGPPPPHQPELGPSSYSQPPHGMHPPPHRRVNGPSYIQPHPHASPSHQPFYHHQPHPSQMHTYPYYQNAPGYRYPPRTMPPPQPHHYSHPPYPLPHHGPVASGEVPVQAEPSSSHPDPRVPTPSAVRQGSATQGSQTYVTAMATGSGNKTMIPSVSVKQTGTTTEDKPPLEVPGHHRKMSSISSFGAVFGDEMKRHHRHSSSTASFLHGIDMSLDGNDAAFLRNLQASHPLIPGAPSPGRPLWEDPNQVAPVTSMEQSVPKLATGGTSKRVRRKCKIDGCTNRVVQGGLCISHGAKRKMCKHPGCTKNVKKAGLCSTHGPARKRCECDGCDKVAVQGGRCIAHGARKKLCSFANCSKQAILGGMCKKHHDSVKLGTDDTTDEEPYCKPVDASTKAKKPFHQRGLSIFGEVSADTVQSVLDQKSDGNLG